MKYCFYVNSSKNCLLYCQQYGRPDTCLQTKNRKFQEPWSLIRHKGRNTLGDELQQQVAETDHSSCAGRASCCSNKLSLRRIAWTSGFVCTGDFLVKICLCNRILSPQQVAQILSDLIFLRHVAVTKIFAKIVQYTRVAATRYCKLSPSVFRPKLAMMVMIDLDRSTLHSLCS